MFDNTITVVPNETNRFGWAKQTERETSPPFNVNRIPSGRAEGHLAASGYSDDPKCQIGGQVGIVEDDFDYTSGNYEQGKSSRTNNKKVETAFF